MIDHVPSAWMSTSFETISMSFESSSPRRFESTARMVGVIPLYACIHVLCVYRYVDVTVSAPDPGPQLRYGHWEAGRTWR